jgi:hypothetical protein
MEKPTPSEERLVPIKLAGLGSNTQITRAGIDPSFTDIKTATVIVFNQAGTEVLQRRNLDYANGDRVYLKPGTYKVFAVANLTDGNCPGDYTAANFFDDVETSADLDDNEYYFVSTATAGAAPSTSTGMPMTSIGSDPTDLTTQIVEVIVPDPIVSGVSDEVIIKMRSIYTKVELTIYNNTSSGVVPQSYLVENLPKNSWIIERPQTDPATGDDYPQSLAEPYTGYANTTVADLLTGWTTTPETINGKNYVKRTITLYTLENRRGVVSGVSANMYERKEKAPANALEITFISTANNKMLYTHVLVGKGRSAETPPDTWYGDYNVDRNSIYRVNVYIDGTNNMESDSRREYLDEIAVCGTLTPPGNGTAIEF